MDSKRPETLLPKCSANLLSEALVFHLQRLRSKTLQGPTTHLKSTGLIKPFHHASNEEHYDRKLFGILADAIIRDFHAASNHARNMAVFVWIPDLLLLCTSEDLDGRMIRAIALEIQKRMDSREPEIQPSVAMADQTSCGSSREFEFVGKDHHHTEDRDHHDTSSKPNVEDVVPAPQPIRPTPQLIGSPPMDDPYASPPMIYESQSSVCTAFPLLGETPTTPLMDSSFD